MFKAKQFIQAYEGSNTVYDRMVRDKPYKSLEAAIKAVLHTGNEGYIIEEGKPFPVWTNIKELQNENHSR